MTIRIFTILICLTVLAHVSVQDKLTVIKAKALVDVRSGRLITPALITRMFGSAWIMKLFKALRIAKMGG